MKKRLLLFAVFFILTTVGCASVEDTPTPQRQDFKGDGERHVGLPQRMGAVVNEGQSAWPGDTVDKGAANAAGGAANEARANNDVGAADDGGIVLLNVKSPARRGDTGSLSIKGKPNESYTITSVFNNSGKVITATAVKRAGADGIASWTWEVSKDTMPGTYGIMITGGGKLLTTVYTVK